MPTARTWLFISAAALAYGLAHLAWYSGTPLGKVPVLDEQENITLARQIATGEVPAEPFYRAMAYPLLLAGFLKVGLAPENLAGFALLLGVFLHASIAVMVGSLGMRWFSSRRAGFIAGLIAALNPVLLYYATQRLDGTLALAFFLAGLVALRLERDAPSWPAFAIAGFSWALALLARPQYITCWIALPLVAFLRWRDLRSAAKGVFALAVGLPLFLLQGFWQSQVAGDFRVLPWQGPYNLWSANRPGANGRFFSQQVDLAYRDITGNPARAESILLYHSETGTGLTLSNVDVTPDTVDAINTHWQRRFLDQVSSHPLGWGALMLRKTYALLNDWDQYNNETYAFHKSRSPWLRFNPIGWGIVFVLGVFGMVRMALDRPAQARAIVALFIACAAGIVLFYVSGRFRLPLATILCVFAGGALADLKYFDSLAPNRRWVAAGVGLIAAVVGFSRFGDVHDTRTFLQDELLLARVSQVVGDDDETWRAAVAARTLAPERVEPVEFMVTSGFNRQLVAAIPAEEVAAWKVACADMRKLQSVGSPAAQTIAAAISREEDALRAMYQGGRERDIDALGGLVLIGRARPAEIQALRDLPPGAGSALFQFARQMLDPANTDATLKAARERIFGGTEM